MRTLAALIGAVVALNVGASQPLAAADPQLSVEATGTGSHSYVYGWSVSKRAAHDSVSIPNGETAAVSYTITATRTKLWDSYGVTLRGCAKNATPAPLDGVSLELQLESAPSPTGPFTDVESASADFGVGTVAAGAEACREVFFGADAGTYSRNRVTASSSSGTTAAATSDTISLPANPTGTWDARASVADAVRACPTGFACEPPSVGFPVFFPSPANDPGPTAAPYTESLAYVQRVTAPLCGSAAGTLENVATLTELDSNQDQGADRTSAATVSLSTGGTTCPEPTTGEATHVTETSATATGTVDTHGLATSAFFEYGPTTTYGSSTDSVPLSGSASVANVASALGPLSPGTTYHYRLATASGANAQVRGYGGDRTFTTAAAPGPPPPPPVTTTICFRGRTLHVPRSELHAYLQRGATQGPCKRRRPRRRHLRS
jgi:hypothetical protein